ncbi:unnamed protein product [Staurois parvus]|uniref:Uncharacterized protein n=1 Tax=Staurois parvus TaxID=386267 RepID=A0ABN9AC04_9NEOB|nr:unnamed protein product [Staurois parvus]
MPISATYQCCHQCHFSASSSVPISATYQCPSVQPISAHHCSLITHISEGEKSLIYKIV